MKIYNLFPLVAGKMPLWIDKLDYIKSLGFNVVYINPIFQTGYNRNIYAPKNFYKFCEEFIDPFSTGGTEQFKNFIDTCHSKGIKVIYELIFTHTSIDSDLLVEHPEWYIMEDGSLKKYTIKAQNSWIEWGDLLELNNNSDNPEIKNSIWQYWRDLTETYILYGVDIIKLHSAYCLPQKELKEFIKDIKNKYPHIEFIGDNLGASFGDMMDLSRAGVDYLFTSFKWWDFKAPWFFEQHYKLKDNIKLISFPENYDTERVSKKYNGNENAQKIFYAIAALLNNGVSVPIGFETGSKIKLNDLSSFSFDFEHEEFDIKDYIKKINDIKSSYTIFSEENDIYYLSQKNENIFALKKMNKEKNEFAILIANLNFSNSEKVVLNDIFYIIESSNIIDISPDYTEIINTKNYEKTLQAGEIRILYSKK